MNPKNQFQIVDSKVVEYKRLLVHKFSVPGDDPVIEAAEQLWKWEQSEEGQWVMQKAVEQPVWHKRENLFSYSVDIVIFARFSDKDATFWQLKWGNDLT